MTFATTVYNLRNERGWSQAELARRAKMYERTLIRLEAGETTPRRKTVRGLAQALGVPPNQLISPGEVAEVVYSSRIPRKPSTLTTPGPASEVSAIARE